MESFARHASRPVFIVGSPRSGTSVLTWALGQHPNLLATEESNWLGSFAIDAAAAYARGSARAERSQLTALAITRDTFLSGFGDAVNGMILDGRGGSETAGPPAAEQLPEVTNRELWIASRLGGHKTRWVDGTPEYSLEIPALVTLFREAQFVHILRDADSVAASLLAFRGDAGRTIVGSAEEAYAYWLRTVQACVDAERALGPGVVHRVRHADLDAEGERVLRGILDFLGEPFVPACLEPLKHRINSSFVGKARPSTPPAATSTRIEQARRLSATLLASPQSTKPDAAVRARWKVEFDERVLHARTLEGHWETAQQMLFQTRLVLTVCGILLACHWAAALTVWLRFGNTVAAVWLGWACALVVAYLWLRRAGTRAVVERALGWVMPWRSNGRLTGAPAVGVLAVQGRNTVALASTSHHARPYASSNRTMSSSPK